MTSFEHLPRAPIVEAVLDLWTRPLEGGVGSLASFAAAVQARFPKTEKRVAQSVILSPIAGAQSTEPEVVALLCRSDDDLDIVQARVDGFSANRLRPYLDWEALRSIAQEYWPKYRALARVDEIERIGIRYINQFELPIPDGDLREETIARFLTVRPSSLGRIEKLKPEGFFLRTAFRPQPHVEGVLTMLTNIENPGLNVSQGPAADARIGLPGVPFVIDIEFRMTGPWGADAAGVWEGFELLRELKNEVFFASITDQLKEVFR